MGESWSLVAESIRRLHATHAPVRGRGHFHVEHGRHPVARCIARLLGLPRPAAAADTRLVVTTLGDGEQWLRTFDGRRLEMRQYESSTSELAERFGVLELRFRLEVSGGSLVYAQSEAALRFGPLRLRIPARWAPRVSAREDPGGPHRVKVGVRVVLPVVGALIRYDGLIDIEDTGA